MSGTDGDAVIGSAHPVECHTVRRTVRFRGAHCATCRLVPADGALYAWGIRPIGLDTIAWYPGAFCSPACHEAQYPAGA